MIRKWQQRQKLGNNLVHLRQQEQSTSSRFVYGPMQVQLQDATVQTEFDRHYVYHPAWAARIIKRIKPAVHVDISSSLHFCSVLSAFVPVKFYDYRPAKLELSGLTSEHADLVQLPFESNSIASLSCMHTVEHIGLGRYGDPLDYDGDLKAIAELSRVLAVGGNLLFCYTRGRRVHHHVQCPPHLYTRCRSVCF
jgi:hypothetical protein